ncbi:hypothetical protein [Neptuniibacter sp. QD37_11]|uniref:hypothetical protein n=1 Tax=Neptuniibacter sp. QD37_11 TaxID=3398209 RepID=UPI0039F4E020
MKSKHKFYSIAALTTILSSAGMGYYLASDISDMSHQISYYEGRIDDRTSGAKRYTDQISGKTSLSPKIAAMAKANKTRIANMPATINHGESLLNDVLHVISDYEIHSLKTKTAESSTVRLDKHRYRIETFEVTFSVNEDFEVLFSALRERGLLGKLLHYEAVNKGKGGWSITLALPVVEMTVLG